MRTFYLLSVLFILLVARDIFAAALHRLRLFRLQPDANIMPHTLPPQLPAPTLVLEVERSGFAVVFSDPSI